MALAKIATNKPNNSLNTDSLSHADQVKEWRKCSLSFPYFVDRYCQIYDSVAEDWIPFSLWKAQYDVAKALLVHQLLVILKARQLGLSWLCLAFGLWLMLFRPIASVLIFSRRDDEASYLLGQERLQGMYHRLPAWMQAERIIVQNEHEFKLSNGSVARAFPTTGGDGYVATYAVIDEADLIDDLKTLLNRVKPTIDAGGKLVLLSRSNKAKPKSRFKAIYRSAKAKKNAYHNIFLPYWVRPGRTEVWYAKQVKDAIENSGTDDDVKEQYPRTDEEAMAPATLDKRIPPAWLEAVYVPAQLVDCTSSPDIPGLDIFVEPIPSGQYAAGADCAEGLPNSDDSVTQWIDRITGEQVAVLRGKLTPAVHAAYSSQVCAYYNNAPIMPENNNHGWAFIEWWSHFSRVPLLHGNIPSKPGWSTTTAGKVILYTDVTEAVKQQTVKIHDYTTYLQLQSIEKGTLLAPQGENEDHADAFALALQAAAAPTQETTIDTSMRVNIGWGNV